MKRREFLIGGPVLCAAPWVASASPVPQPIPEPHFPGRLHQFVWRNWELANTNAMAKVLRTSEAKVLEVGKSMGLPEKRTLTPDQVRRIYITVIRQNWHLLPESQIIELLGWSREKFEFTLKEDDFLSNKLGRKPECSELVYRAPAAEEQSRAAKIRRVVRESLGSAIQERGEDHFQFVKTLSQPARALLWDHSQTPLPSEVDLSKGWQVVSPRQPVLEEAALRFSEYLQLPAKNGKRILFEIDPARLPSTGSFEIHVGDSEIHVAGHDEGGVLQGIYWLEDQMEHREAPFLPKGTAARHCVWNPRYLYSYFSLYGDMLLDADIDPFPDAYLEKLARAGINGVWIHTVLNTLAYSKHFPEFGKGSETRLKNLNKLVQRTRRFGVKLFLYVNEPRAMPEEFFKNRPEIKGAASHGFYAMCTSTPVVREWIASSLAHVFKQAPDLGGIFTITMSENHTNCFSHGGAWGTKAPVAKGCPRCSKREGWEVIGELIQTFRDGVKSSSPSAEVIAWDWGWPSEMSAKLIPVLPKDVDFLSVSEWYHPVSRGGVNTKVGEYSISVVGPGPRATENWKLARERDLRIMAKVQFNNSWEIAAVPYIPVANLVLEHCRNLSRAGISGIMPSWTCGGYPSPNFAAAKAYYFEPRRSNQQILAEVAQELYGRKAAPDILAAWEKFSKAFVEFPYGVSIYRIPTQHGPANALRFRPTGYRSTMLLFPYDDLKGWSGSYPPEVVFKQFSKLASLWKEGLAPLRSGLAKAAKTKRERVQTELAIAETSYNHFQSVADQVEFYLLRAKLEKAGPGDRKATLERMRSIAEQEIEIAKRQFAIARRHSLIAYEASNHYFYTPLDLVEKILNCRQVVDEISSEDNL